MCQKEAERFLENRGVYIIWLSLLAEHTISVGKLGAFVFPQGTYAYCGSAQRNLSSRIARHKRVGKPRRWHIDYLREFCLHRGESVFYNIPKDGECVLVKRILQGTNGYTPVPGFGSSDCTCVSHLVYVRSDYPCQIWKWQRHDWLNTDFPL